MVRFLLMVRFQLVLILIEVLFKEIFTRIIFMRFGKTNFNHFEIENGQRLVNVNHAKILKIVREMGFITGMEIAQMVAEQGGEPP